MIAAFMSVRDVSHFDELRDAYHSQLVRLPILQ